MSTVTPSKAFSITCSFSVFVVVVESVVYTVVVVVVVVVVAFVVVFLSSLFLLHADKEKTIHNAIENRIIFFITLNLLDLWGIPPYIISVAYL